MLFTSKYVNNYGNLIIPLYNLSWNSTDILAVSWFNDLKLIFSIERICRKKNREYFSK